MYRVSLLKKARKFSNSTQRGVTGEDFTINPEGRSAEQRQKILKLLYKDKEQNSRRYLGYQLTVREDYTELLDYLNIDTSYLGDPFIIGDSNLNTKIVEQKLLEYYAQLWNAKINPNYDFKDEEAYWGYVLSMGSTEGNMYALYNARDYLEGNPLIVDSSVHKNSELKDPVIFYSQETHYSIIKCCSVLKLKTMQQLGNGLYPEECPFSEKWPASIPSDEDGSIDVKSLTMAADFFSKRGHPVIVNFNLGTTFKGGFDQVPKASESVLEVLHKNNMFQVSLGGSYRNGYWFHIDGALGAGYLPYLEKAAGYGMYCLPKEFPHFDFRKDCIQSIVASGHKWTGAPWPCGIYMTKNKYRLLPPSNPTYTGSLDSTFSGSRNGASPLVMWDFHSKYSEEDKARMAANCVQMAESLDEKLHRVEEQLGYSIQVRHSPMSLAVRFLRPNKEIMEKYSLCQDYEKVNSKWEEFTHVYCMRHVTSEVLEELCEDLTKHPNPFPNVNN